MHIESNWWFKKREALLAIANDHSNAFVYDLDSVRAAAARMTGLQSVDRVLYAVKANYNARVLSTLAANGVDFDCVSPGEIQQVRDSVAGGAAGRILFTPNFAPREEYVFGVEAGVRVTLDNLYPLRAWPEIFSGAEIFIRIDPNQGGGHHQHVVTGGSRSKFGVSMSELDELQRLVDASGATVTGIHAHSGSGILDPGNWQRVAACLVEAARRFPAVRALDLGGGMSVPQMPGDAAFDLQSLDDQLGEFKHQHDQYELWLEPGRYLVSESGVLLSQVTQTKEKDGVSYVGIGTGTNALIRPALYDAWHLIINLSKIDQPSAGPVTIVGPLCESGDRLGEDRQLPDCEEGDVMLIANAGAYGRVMSSGYNLRDIPPEILIED